MQFSRAARNSSAPPGLGPCERAKEAGFTANGPEFEVWNFRNYRTFGILENLSKCREWRTSTPSVPSHSSVSLYFSPLTFLPFFSLPFFHSSVPGSRLVPSMQQASNRGGERVSECAIKPNRTVDAYTTATERQRFFYKSRCDVTSVRVSIILFQGLSDFYGFGLESRFFDDPTKVFRTNRCTLLIRIDARFSAEQYYVCRARKWLINEHKTGELVKAELDD